MRDFNIARIEIHADQSPAGLHPPKQVASVTSKSDRAVDDDLTRPGIERGHDLIKQNGNMAWRSRHRRMI
jgi:hypothetical protein